MAQPAREPRTEPAGRVLVLLAVAYDRPPVCQEHSGGDTRCPGGRAATAVGHRWSSPGARTPPGPHDGGGPRRRGRRRPNAGVGARPGTPGLSGGRTMAWDGNTGAPYPGGRG